MPIYAYKCEACGFAKDVLQKMSDAPLTACPACGQAAFRKQLTAAGFQLKGSGWYVTDFKGNGAQAAAGPDKGGDGAKSGETGVEKPVSAGASSEGASKPADSAPAKAGSTSGSGSDS